MKIWWVVAWDNYYPDGSLDNVIETFNKESEAINFADTIRVNGHHISYEYKGKVIEYPATYDNVEVINVADKLGL